MTELDPRTLTARGIAAAVRAGTLAPEAVAEAYLDRIATLEPQVRAFAFHDPAAVRAEAGRAAATRRDGLLAGVPIGIKDVLDTGDMPTEYGSRAYPGLRPARDAGAVHIVRRAGAVGIGKTVTTEFATAAPGATLNPFDATRTPGGSSSGSAAGLGAAFFPLAFGTQTSGSTVRPASFCGVVGYKASRHLIDRTGVKPLAESLDVVGLMARDTRDVALLAAAAMRRPELLPADEPPALPQIALFAPDEAVAPSATSLAVLETVAGLLGRVTANTAVPDWWLPLIEAQSDVFAWEGSACLAPERDLHWDRLHPATHDFLRRQDGITFERWQAGIAARDAGLADLDTLFAGADLLLTQAAPGEAPVGLGSTGQAQYNSRWTLLGTPSLSLPAGLGPDGMPVGVQLVARPGQDALLLALAPVIEDRLRAAGLPARPERP
ncbi:amidase [Frigidibacter sp. MR17.14]|uniref:amidase n=1 Tax=Frigidibacter sp. MR17.14 TaxID=3126509 RepID=UPI003012A856